ncbi:hypothetical protein E8E12_011559 [Didymella heteroderae]|uniref:Uncharacterized protein n=1 Tax=Didymella heteroderae TaxID=1769908 RepID=A0A9P4X0X1_9PLEO|nr:hypothetical protein E8E12_011559 [Didymella heteroderae]
MDIDRLYVVKRTLLIDQKNTAERTMNIALPATFADLAAAKKMAQLLLGKEGYETDYFSQYDVNNNSPEWKHGDNVIVYARGPSKELFYVEVETIPDYIGLQADNKGRVKAPLYHVLQTVVSHRDRSGSRPTSIVRGTHTRSQLAQKQALGLLLNDHSKADFDQYEEYSDDKESPFGADVVVHAIKDGDQEIFVSIIPDH